MATAKKIQSDIASLKIAIRVAKNDAIKKKLKSRLEMAENELASIKSGAKPRKVSTSKGTKSLLERAKALVKKNPKFSGYKGSGVDLEKDAKEGALPIGRRISKGLKANQVSGKGNAKQNKGNVYYEYRVNRLDVKQPKGKQSYPKLEDGGYMAKGGEIEVGDSVIVELNNGKIIQGKIEKLNPYKIRTSPSDTMVIPNSLLLSIKKLSDVMMADGGYMAKGGYVAVSEKDGYWTIISKPTTKDKAQKQIDLGVPRGEVGKVVTLEEAKAHKKVIGKEYLADGGYMAKGGKLDVGVYRVGKPTKVSPMLYEQKIVEIFGNGDISTASDYGRKLSDFNLQKYPIISKEQLDAQYKMANGGYMAKGGEIIPYIIWVSKDGEKREFYGDYKSQRAAEMAMKKLWDSSDYKSMGNKPKKMYEKDGFYKYGGYMEKGGKSVGFTMYYEPQKNLGGKSVQSDAEIRGNYKAMDAVLDKKLGDNYLGSNFYIGDGYGKVILQDEKGRYKVKQILEIFDFEDKTSMYLKGDGGYMAKGGYMAHGGETHRAEDPEVEVDEDEMKVVRGYSDDEAYEYAKGGMTLKAGDIVEATTGVKLKVMDFKPDFGGRALVQRIDEFGEGLKPAWMPLTKFKLPKLI
jgi:hypothetical protein